MDLQKIINDLIANNAEVAKYAENIVYVPQGKNWQEIPNVSFALKLVNKEGDEVVVAFSGVAPYGFIANALLKVL